ncbi:MAG: PrgI family protein [Candidatus Yonathbacteria bacterium]|nr:PrgI family protein [Candidatus Yonathbacteria bacterium]
MQFQVPQFIEVEDRIFGPLTFKQFIYLVGGAGICFVLYIILPFFFAVLLIIPFAGFSLALAFYKINNRPFISVVESALNYTLKGKLYVWKKVAIKPSTQKGGNAKPASQSLELPKLSDSRLKELSWSLDVHQNVQ